MNLKNLPKNGILPFAATLALGVGVLSYTAPEYPSDRYIAFNRSDVRSNVRKLSEKGYENCYNPAVSMDLDTYYDGGDNYYQPHSGFTGAYLDDEKLVRYVDNGSSTYFFKIPPKVGKYYYEQCLCVSEFAECSTRNYLEENDNLTDFARIYSYDELPSEAEEYFRLYNMFKGDVEEAMLEKYFPKDCKFTIVQQGDEIRPDFPGYCEERNGTPCPSTISDVLRLLPESEGETLVGLLSSVSPYSYPEFIVNSGLLY